LGNALDRLGVPVIRASVDGFHHPREIRYRLGRDSPEGFYRDSYDLDALQRELLDPLSPGGSRR
jgi:uridine kinase